MELIMNNEYLKKDDPNYIDLINDQKTKIEAARVVIEMYAALEMCLSEGSVSSRYIRSALHGAVNNVFREHDKDLDYSNYHRDEIYIQRWTRDLIDLLTEPVDDVYDPANKNYTDLKV